MTDWENDVLEYAAMLHKSGGPPGAADRIELLYAKILEMRVAYEPDKIHEDMTPLGRNILDILIDQNKKLMSEQNAWTAIADRFPETGRYIVARTVPDGNTYVDVATLVNEPCGALPPLGGASHVTHWMPLPAPPTDAK